MIIYWSMILWIFLIYILYDITHKEEIALTDYNLQQGIQRRVPWAYAFLVFGYFIFWASMRHYVADTTAYVTSFNNYSTNFSEEFSKLNWDPWSSEGKGGLLHTLAEFNCDFLRCVCNDNIEKILHECRFLFGFVFVFGIPVLFGLYAQRNETVYLCCRVIFVL